MTCCQYLEQSVLSQIGFDDDGSAVVGGFVAVLECPRHIADVRDRCRSTTRPNTELTASFLFFLVKHEPELTEPHASTRSFVCAIQQILGPS